MTREETEIEVIKQASEYRCLLLELPTGYGKSKLALDIVASYNKPLNVLIVCPQKVHKDSWEKEIKKWYKTANTSFRIMCYASIQKATDEVYDIVILDEAHHLSDRCKQILKSLQVNLNIIALSATLGNDLRQWFAYNYKCKYIQRSLQNAIDDNVLPQPKIYLVGMEVPDDGITEIITRNPKLSNTMIVTMERFPNYMYRKDTKIECLCTKKFYLKDLNRQIEWYKEKSMRGNDWCRLRWLKLCGDRLKWLARIKTPYIKDILAVFKNYRTLTFCADIKQTEDLGKNCINSKNKKTNKILKEFNAKKIKHITSCNMLNEGVNLADCRIGILANINASERITIQRIGRILRHKEPILIIPYWKDTREEEIVRKFLQDYDTSLIFSVTVEQLNNKQIEL